jgi:hypothetical protein
MALADDESPVFVARGMNTLRASTSISTRWPMRSAATAR